MLSAALSLTRGLTEALLSLCVTRAGSTLEHPSSKDPDTCFLGFRVRTKLVPPQELPFCSPVPRTVPGAWSSRGVYRVNSMDRQQIERIEYRAFPFSVLAIRPLQS